MTIKLILIKKISDLLNVFILLDNILILKFILKFKFKEKLKNLFA